ncbi:MAG TPA: tetratricopeptide repeat protein [Candidatus Desulfofervidus auxilii]|uniref:Tetratricopeptide repeat protein n=1 Tax=Desulfofervidus auxilii TaxID=1621989 RepID=A0A7C0Y8A5_DESA2|nr:tetratricopeptide repeat protein [Candidatus Desulfofervidus auxilii]
MIKKIDKALVYYEEARNLTSDELMKLALNVEITDLLISGKNNYEEAIPYLKEAMYISEKLNKNIENTWAIVILGYVYFKIKDFKNAKKYLTEGLKKSIKFDDKKLQALAYFYLGDLYFSENKIQEAKYNFKKAYELYNSLG